MTDLAKLTETERGAYLAQMDFLKKQEIFKLEKELKWHQDSIKLLEVKDDSSSTMSPTNNKVSAHWGLQNTLDLIDSRNKVKELEKQLYFYRGME